MIDQRGKSGLEVNLTKLCDIFAVDHSTARRWVSKGCPYVQEADRTRAKEWVFNTLAVSDWLREKDVELATAIQDEEPAEEETAKEIKLKAEAEMARLNLRARRQELIEMEDVKRAVSDAFNAVRAKVLGLGPKLAPVVIQCKTPAEALKEINDLTYEALSELSGLKHVSSEETEESAA